MHTFNQNFKNMKKPLLLLVAIAAVALSFTKIQDDKKGLARVNRINGKEVYFMNEPLNAYEIVFDIGTSAKAASLLTAGLVNEGVSDKASQFVKRAIKEAEDEHYEFDAIIYSSGKRVVAIKFTEEKEENKMLARVQKIEGVEIYILSEPLNAYEVANSKKSGLKVKSLLTMGIVNNSIEQDVAEFVRKLLKDADKDDEKINAILYGAGKSAVGVRFI